MAYLFLVIKIQKKHINPISFDDLRKINREEVIVTGNYECFSVSELLKKTHGGEESVFLNVLSKTDSSYWCKGMGTVTLKLNERRYVTVSNNVFDKIKDYLKVTRVA